MTMFFPSEVAVDATDAADMFSASFNGDNNVYGSGLMNLDNGLSLRLLKN